VVSPGLRVIDQGTSQTVGRSNVALVQGDIRMAKRDTLPGLVARTVITSAAASAASALALALLARVEGRGALRPLNASSHWLNGNAAVRDARPDTKRTAVGLVTHHLATMLWSGILESMLGARKRTLPLRVLNGAAVAMLSAFVDYVLMPRRLSPGWELALTRKSMAGAFSAMAVGLIAGAFAARSGPLYSGRRRRSRQARG
jgi:hypothetical protein